VLLAVMLADCSPSAHAKAVAAPDDSIGQPLDSPVPGSIRSLPLVSSDGTPVSLSTLAGKVVVVSDMMTLCQETCPIDTATLVAVARAVEDDGLGNQVEFLSVTIDPARDDARHLAAYRQLFAPAPADWLTVTGTPANLATFWHYLGVYVQQVPDSAVAPHDWLTHRPLTYDLNHSDEEFFLDQQGRERFLLEGTPHLAPGAKIPEALSRFMDAEGRQNLTDPVPEAWTEPQALQVLSWLTGREIHS
jgi:protein SCO1/2